MLATSLHHSDCGHALGNMSRMLAISALPYYANKAISLFLYKRRRLITTTLTSSIKNCWKIFYMVGSKFTWWKDQGSKPSEIDHPRYLNLTAFPDSEGGSRDWPQRWRKRGQSCLETRKFSQNLLLKRCQRRRVGDGLKEGATLSWRWWPNGQNPHLTSWKVASRLGNRTSSGTWIMSHLCLVLLKALSSYNCFTIS